MMEWELHITYSLKPYKLRAVLEYHSSQVMRIRVYGIKRSILLENNYPLLLQTKSKKGIQWKIKEGAFDSGNEKNSFLMLQIMGQLESYIKMDLPTLL